MRLRIAAALAGLLMVTPAGAQQTGVAYLEVDLNTRATMASERPGLIDTPILPGSVMKIATLAAALESGVLDGRTGILCTRQVTVAGHRLICTHSDLHRPLRPAEALAHSCNVFFATIAARLSRSAFDQSLASLGLPPSDPSQPVTAAALGVAGARATPRQLLDMLSRVAVHPTTLPWQSTTLDVVREGLKGAAQYGTAAVFASRDLDVVAKTGTTIASTGLSQGIVVGAMPSAKPTVAFVLLASGAAGLHAADLAADRLRPAEPGVLVMLPAGEERDREGIQRLALSARDALAKALGVTPPARITLRFHPTVEGYQRATGLPWFTTGATLGQDVHFIPAAALRQRGLLERSVRHELVHVLTGPALVDRPLWVREGAAQYFAGERRPSEEPAARSAETPAFRDCPADGELRRPSSQQALSAAYARAAACFARAMESGKTWTDVR